jgi:hypothetical protein
MNFQSPILALAVLLLAGQVGAREAVVPPPLAQDERLVGEVTVAVKDRPLGDVLPEIGKKLGVPLTAARETADDKITLFIKERPAREVLALISDHFDFQWRRDRDGYRLGQDLASRTREQALRDARDAEEMAAIQRKLSRVTALLPFDREKGREVSLDLVPRLRDPDTSNAERLVVLDRLEDWGLASLAPAEAAMELLHWLPAVHQSAVWSGEPVAFSTRDGSLPAEVAGRIRRGLAATATTGVSGFTQVTALVQVSRARASSHELMLAVSLLLHDDAGGGLNGDWHVRSRPILWGDLFQDAREEPGDPELRYPVHLPPLAQPRPSPRRALLEELQLVATPRRPWSDLLQVVHEQTGLDILSDSYTRTWITQQLESDWNREQPLYRLLHRLGHSLDYRWEKRPGLLLLRSLRRPHDRQEEVPGDVLRRMRELSELPGRPNLADYAALASRLTDPQAESLGTYWSYYFPELTVLPLKGTSFPKVVRLLRWWDALGPAQREAAGAAGLPLAAQAPAQRQALLRAALLVATEPRNLARLGAVFDGQLVVRVRIAELEVRPRGSTGAGGRPGNAHPSSGVLEAATFEFAVAGGPPNHLNTQEVYVYRVPELDGSQER